MPTQLQLTKETHEVHGSALLPILSVEKEKQSAPIVIQSKRTGKDYTFKISRAKYKGQWYTHIWLEQGGYKKFSHLGTWASAAGIKGGIIKDRERVTTDAAEAITWVLRRVEATAWNSLDRNIRLMHSGRCLACGRELTDAESIKRGTGPVCAEQGRGGS